MKRIKLMLLLGISIALMPLVVQNTVPIQANYLWLTADVPVILLLFLAALGGFVSGLLVPFLLKNSAKSKP